MNESPKVSILIAVRNEEKVIERLLSSIEQLNYPSDKLQVLIGNDHSQDHTGCVLDKYAAEHPNWYIIHLIDEPSNRLKGKARVLENLSKHATGDFFFYTDADIKLPPNWVNGMLRHFTSNTGVVVGTSSMEKGSLFAKMQSMEWLSVLHFNHSMAKLKIPTTGMGNNMVVSKEAYEQVGGYKKIGFSIVEDYALYKAIIELGFDFDHTFDADCHAFTLPPTFFLEQRNRWIKGAISSKSKFIIPALIQAFSLPIYLILAIWFWPLALFIWLFFVSQAFIALYKAEKNLGLINLKWWSPIFCIYTPISWAIQMTYFVFQGGKVKWKGRDYNL